MVQHFPANFQGGGGGRRQGPPPPRAINTIVGHGRHLRGFPVNQKNWLRGCARLDAGVAHGCARLAVKMAHGCARRGPSLAHGYNHVSGGRSTGPGHGTPPPPLSLQLPADTPSTAIPPHAPPRFSCRPHGHPCTPRTQWLPLTLLSSTRSIRS